MSINLFTSHKLALDSMPKIIKNNIIKWRELNESLGFKYFSDIDIDFWIHRNLSPEQIRLYNSLGSGAGRADFFRIAYLINQGGIWFDADLPSISILSKCPDLFDYYNKYSFLLFNNRKTNDPRYTLIGGRNNSELFVDLFNKICENIRHEIDQPTHKTTIEITGPWVLGKILSKYFTIQNLVFPVPNRIVKYLGDTGYYFHDPTVVANSYEEENTIANYRNALKQIDVEYHGKVPAIKKHGS